MVYLNTNTANQYAWLSLDEGRAFFNVAFTYYLLVLTYEMTGEQLAQVVEVINENERVTKIRLTTWLKFLKELVCNSNVKTNSTRVHLENHS